MKNTERINKWVKKQDLTGEQSKNIWMPGWSPYQNKKVRACKRITWLIPARNVLQVYSQNCKASEAIRMCSFSAWAMAKNGFSTVVPLNRWARER